MNIELGSVGVTEEQRYAIGFHLSTALDNEATEEEVRQWFADVIDRALDDAEHEYQRWGENVARWAAEKAEAGAAQ